MGRIRGILAELIRKIGCGGGAIKRIVVQIVEKCNVSFNSGLI